MSAPYIYKCPAAGLEIQGFRDEGVPPAGAARRFELVHCPACGRSHIIEPTTGRLLSDLSPRNQAAGSAAGI